MRNLTKPILMMGLMAIFVLGGAFAQTKIGTVDRDRILRESSAGKSLATGLEAVGKTIKSEIDGPKATLASSQQALKPLVDGKSEQQIAADPALRARVEGYAKEVGNYAKLEQKSAQEMALTERAALAQFNQHAAQAVKTVMERKGLDLILNTNQFVFAKPELDVSSEVIAELDAKTPNISVTRQRIPKRTPPAQ